MIDGVTVQTLHGNKDSRGLLVELWRSDWLDCRPQMAYLSLTLPGEERGPHEHRQQTDVMAFPGPGVLLLRLVDARPVSPTFREEQTLTVGEWLPALVTIPPGVMHGYLNVGAVPALCVNLPDALYAGPRRSQPVDEIRHELTGLTMSSPKWIQETR